MIFIGIDLAWSSKNSSGVCVMLNKEIIFIGLVEKVEHIIQIISAYEEVLVGIDAPITINNKKGSRVVEKDFLKDFSRHKIGILPINRALIEKYSFVNADAIRKRLESIGLSYGVEKSNFIEVYPHSTIAVYFNNYKILLYKRKKGRTTQDIKDALKIYQTYLKLELSHELLSIDIEELRGKKLKDYEDKLDAITSAFTLHLCYYKLHKFKLYGDKDNGLMVSLL